MPVGFNKMGNVEVITFQIRMVFQNLDFIYWAVDQKYAEKLTRCLGAFLFPEKGTDQTQEGHQRF